MWDECRDWQRLNAYSFVVHAICIWSFPLRNASASLRSFTVFYVRSWNRITLWYSCTAQASSYLGEDRRISTHLWINLCERNTRARGSCLQDTISAGQARVDTGVDSSSHFDIHQRPCWYWVELVADSDTATARLQLLFRSAAMCQLAVLCCVMQEMLDMIWDGRIWYCRYYQLHSNWDNSDKRAGADGPTKLVFVQIIVLTEQVLSITSALERGDKRCWCWYIRQHAELQVSRLVCIAEEELL
jgi:hypothetical protein